MNSNWLDNPFRTIIEVAELNVRKSIPVLQSMESLKKLYEETGAENKHAERRIEKAITYLKETFPKDRLESPSDL